MSAVSEVIVAVTGLLVPVGGGAAFVWNKLQKRFEDIENKLQECHDRELENKEREAHHTERRTRQLTVIELLWQEVERLSPDGNKVLVRAKRLLDQLKVENKEEQ